MRKNRIRERLAAGEMALGGNVASYAPDLVELLGAMGLDWVFIDCEHGAMNESEVTNMVRAADIYDMTAIVRVPTNSPHVILRFMDVGVMGVVIPHLDTKEDAERAVRAVKYHPMGERGSNYGGGRNNDYGIGMTDVREYYAASNRETMVIALIESAEAVQNIDEILSVPGLDVGWLGPSDMAQSMGFPGQDAVDGACDRVVEATVRAGKIAAVAHPPYSAIDTMSHYYDLGARMMSTSPMTIVKDGMAEWVRTTRGLAARDR